MKAILNTNINIGNFKINCASLLPLWHYRWYPLKQQVKSQFIGLGIKTNLETT